jgi:hypothetical protein
MVSSALPLSGTFQNAQLTYCHFHRRINGYGVITIIHIS